MLRLDLICLTNSGISAARMMRVRPMIDSAQAAPPDGSRPSQVHRLCHPIRMNEMA